MQLRARGLLPGNLARVAILVIVTLFRVNTGNHLGVGKSAPFIYSKLQ